jgi:anti-sigma regulatory factor (Ser/Thr protein kinase)
MGAEHVERAAQLAKGAAVHPTVRAAYPADRTAVARARRFVRETLAGWGAHDAIDDAVLLTSELATNAVIHARTPFEVICRTAGASVQIEVVDGDTTRVLPAPGNGDDPNRVSGRGLLMPVMLAAEWGVSYAVTSKTVWFRLGTGAAPFPPGMPPPAFTVPRIPGVEHALARRPSGDAHACPALLEFFEAAPDRWRFTVGDMGGTAPEAAGLARHGLRLLAAEGHGVAAAVTRLNRAVVRDGGHARLMTLLHGELVRRPGAGLRLTLVSAGPPPPLRLTSAGELTALTEAQLRLGAVRDALFEEQAVDLDPGDVLLYVTGRAIDGVTPGGTGHGRAGVEGLRRLLADGVYGPGPGGSVRPPGLTADAVADHLSAAGIGDLSVLLMRAL